MLHFNGRENGHVTEVFTLIEGEWLLYRGGQFKGGRMVMLRRLSLQWEGEWSCYRGGQYNGRRRRSCYGGGQFKGGRMVMLQKSSV